MPSLSIKTSDRALALVQAVADLNYTEEVAHTRLYVPEDRITLSSGEPVPLQTALDLVVAALGDLREGSGFHLPRNDYTPRDVKAALSAAGADPAILGKYAKTIAGRVRSHFS